MVQIAKKKQTRLKPIGRTPKARVKERGDSIGRTAKRPPTKKDRMGPKILRLDAPLPGKPRTSKSPKKTIGSLMSEGMSKGMATNAMKKAAMELAKRRKPSGRPKPKKKFGPITPKSKKGKPQFMNPIGKVPKSRIPELRDIIRKRK